MPRSDPVYHHPRVLVITLKRFARSERQTRKSLFGLGRQRSASKVTTPVRVPNDALDLSPFTNPSGSKRQECGSVAFHTPASPTYRLIAEVHHTGSLSGGHYTACGRAACDGRWFRFDDETVRREERLAERAASAAPYIFFFRLAFACDGRV
ncbi:hypothetical protein FOA52_000341 [Chlamydomonas sp. UWO 241]|nr:hypothetical protein FOA52_000341 [Chlamydomonas sp. UWO 241]